MIYSSFLLKAASYMSAPSIVMAKLRDGHTSQMVYITRFDGRDEMAIAEFKFHCPLFAVLPMTLTTLAELLAG